MSDEKKPAAKKPRPSEAAIRKALDKSPELVSVDGPRVSVVYPDLAAYNAQTSADVEALRSIGEIASSECSAFDPERDRLLNPNTPALPSHLPKPDGAQRLVVVFA